MPALDPAAFAGAVAAGAMPLDLRHPAHFSAAHVPGSVFLQFGRQDLGDRAELYLPRAGRYALVMEPLPLAPVAEQLLAAAGYAVTGHLGGGMKAWSQSGHLTATLPTTTVAAVQAAVAGGGTLHLLDVRDDFEYNWGHITGAVNIPHDQIWQRAAELNRADHWHVICNDQVRSGAAASILVRLGFCRVTLVPGGTVAWTEAGYPLVKTG